MLATGVPLKLCVSAPPCQITRLLIFVQLRQMFLTRFDNTGPDFSRDYFKTWQEICAAVFQKLQAYSQLYDQSILLFSGQDHASAF